MRATPLRYLRLVSVFYRPSIETPMECLADFHTRILASLLGAACNRRLPITVPAPA
ncbi:MAG TPA: hypothetical protein VLH79_03710 [Chthonomonadales bacterium]|nr:hypothetical protein [Chthonomonadales bacterium]